MSNSTGLFSKLKKTREGIFPGLLRLFHSQPIINDEIFDDLEDALIMADLGVESSSRIVRTLRQLHKKEKFDSSEAVYIALRNQLKACFDPLQQRSLIHSDNAPSVVIMLGVNGVGKTTTTAKIARFFQTQDNKIMLAACDTFRAAAIDQLQNWGEKLNIPVVSQQIGSDAAAVAYDALASARAKGIDLLLIDTAGRQHTHSDLMAQLQKIKRVLVKDDADLPLSVLITVDAGNGQNIISQIESFNKAIPLTGICVTKLDGTAKGGVVISLAEKFNLPIYFVGVGEKEKDLRPFDAEEFVSALLPDVTDIPQ